MYKNFIFDLDGTLLSTIADMKDAVNAALRECGYSHQFDIPGTMGLVGDGSDMLIHRALKEFDGPDTFLQLKKAFLPKYLAFQGRSTKPFEGILMVLEKLSQKGCKLFIASNKPDPMAQAITKATLPVDLFLGIYGHKDGDPVKPNPIQVERILASFSLEKEETVYVGDSHVDIKTAENGGLKCALCLWGYDTNYPQIKEKAAYLLSTPLDILKLA